MNRQIIIALRDKVYWISPRNIISMVASGSYTLLNVRDIGQLKVAKNLNSMMELLPNDCNYILRFHKSWAINVKRIKAIERAENQHLIRFDDGQVLFFRNPALKTEILDFYNTLRLNYKTK